MRYKKGLIMISLAQSTLAGLLFFAGSAKAMNVELICLEPTDLSKKIAKKLNKKLHVPTFQKFADGELNVVLKNPTLFRDKIVLLIQSTGTPVNEHMLGVAFCAQELKNAGAHKVIAVVPYFGYGRQEASKISGKPGHATVVAKLFEGAGIDELVAVELHDLAILDLFTIPVHNISVQHTIAQHIKARLKLLDAICMIAPDHGARAYVDEIGSELKVETLTFQKERYGKDKTRVIGHVGKSGKEIGVMVDDIISTGGTAVNACSMLHDQGFSTMYGYFVHPVLAGPAIERVKESHFAKIFVGNTLPLSEQARSSEFIQQFDVSDAIVAKLQEILYENHIPAATFTFHSATQ